MPRKPVTTTQPVQPRRARPGAPKVPRKFNRPHLTVRQPSFPLRPRGPLKPVFSRPQASREPGDPPPTWPGTRSEYLVFWWLTTVKRLQPGVDFVYQAPILGGRIRRGGQVLDFLIGRVKTRADRDLVLFVNGVYWHAFGAARRRASVVSVEAVRRLGYDVVVVWEDDLDTRLDQVMTLALRGIEIKRPLTL